MTNKLPTYPRILGLSLSSRGFGYALLEGLDTLGDWGVKSVRGDKNKETVEKVEELITDYQPDVVVLEDSLAKFSHRSARIRRVTGKIVTMAKAHRVRVLMFSREQVRKTFFGEGRGTKQALAEIVASKFPDELGFRLPPKRRPWMSEDYRMAIFDAVALALVVRRHTTKTRRDVK